MCKEDVRIKRKTATRSVQVSSENGTAVEAFPPNPNRVALTLVYVNQPDRALGAQATLRGGAAADSPGLLSISDTSPNGVVTVEEIGILITFPVVVRAWDANAAGVVVTEVFFTERLEDV